MAPSGSRISRRRRRTSGRRHQATSRPGSPPLAAWRAAQSISRSTVLSSRRTYRDIHYWERGQVGYLAFDFYNGAMSTQQCRRFTTAFRYARSRPTRVLCLLGGRDFWSNGINLNVIEAADNPASESWRNINAIDDVVLQILSARQLVISGLRGNAGAGGVMLALAADHVYAREGAVLNPHYRTMGNLYGSEYWTYTLPRRVGVERALEITTACQPMGADEACQIGLLDKSFGTDADEFLLQLQKHAQRHSRPTRAWRAGSSINSGADGRTSAPARWRVIARANWRT